MEPTVASLQSQCKNLQTKINEEKTRLESMQKTLEQCKANKNVEQERESNAGREEEIKDSREKVENLKVEFGVLRKEIGDIEKDRTEVVAAEIEKRKRSLNVLSAEIDMWDGEIAKLERQIQKLKDMNMLTDKENKRKLKQAQEKVVPLTESRSLGQLGRLRIQEETAKLYLQEINESKKKTLKGLEILRTELEQMETLCEEQQKKNKIKEYHYLTVLDSMVVRQREICEEIDERLKQAKLDLKWVRSPRKQRRLSPGIDELNERNRRGCELIESYKMRVEELRLESGILYGAVAKIKRDRLDFAEGIAKKREGATMKVNAELYRMKNEIDRLDEKIDRLRKINKWKKHNFEKAIEEKLEVSPFDQRALARLRADEDEAKKELETLLENSKKLEEQICFHKDTLAGLQNRCIAEEKKAEEIVIGLTELRKFERNALSEEVQSISTISATTFCNDIPDELVNESNMVESII